MRPLIVLASILWTVGCVHTARESGAQARLVGTYVGQDSIDTQEIITLKPDHSFEYDFIPLGATGESYRGRWQLKDEEVVLAAPLQDGGAIEYFHLALAYEKGVPVLTYSWPALKGQRARMLIPNRYVRSIDFEHAYEAKPRTGAPNNSPEATLSTRPPEKPSPSSGAPHL